MTTHECTFDDRGICETCKMAELREDRMERWSEYNYSLPASHPKYLPFIEEFPTPYEFGKMEHGEWD